MIKRAISSVLFCFLFVAANALAQGANDATSPPPDTTTPMHNYRADYSLIESENGKKIDLRQYSVNLSNGGRSMVQIGTKVPVEAKADGTLQYLDADTQIVSRLIDHPNGLVLDVSCNVTNVASDATPQTDRPVFRTFVVANDIVIVPGRSMVVGVADDPDSKRQFELDVTVTELK
ncbi:MAG TPA: hypothetical protein VMB47_10170 [Candidatus Aquilonibacter sp.]|nr:hypothetical protein [Candidatus Aquilonibacter sp.]